MWFERCSSSAGWLSTLEVSAWVGACRKLITHQALHPDCSVLCQIYMTRTNSGKGRPVCPSRCNGFGIIPAGGEHRRACEMLSGLSFGRPVGNYLPPLSAALLLTIPSPLLFTLSSVTVRQCCSSYWCRSPPDPASHGVFAESVERASPQCHCQYRPPRPRCAIAHLSRDTSFHKG